MNWVVHYLNTKTKGQGRLVTDNVQEITDLIAKLLASGNCEIYIQVAP